MDRIELLIGFICCVLAIVVTADSMVRTRQYNDLRLRRERNMVISAAISASFIILYPLIFHLWIGMNTLAGVGLCWTIIMVLYDLLLISPETKEEDQTALFTTSNAANVVVGACWATGSLIHAISKQGINASGAKVLLVSLILCVSFVLGTHSKNDQSRTATAVRTAQRLTLHASVGLFISGIVLSIT